MMVDSEFIGTSEINGQRLSQDDISVSLTKKLPMRVPQAGVRQT